MILRDVWRDIRKDMAQQSVIRFGWLNHSFLHSIEANTFFIAVPKDCMEQAYSPFMEKGKLEIQNLLFLETGLKFDIEFNSDLF